MVFGMWSIWLSSWKRWAPSLSPLTVQLGSWLGGCAWWRSISRQSLQHVLVARDAAEYGKPLAEEGWWHVGSHQDSELPWPLSIPRTLEHIFVAVCDLALDYVNRCTWPFKLQVATQLAHEDLHDLFRPLWLSSALSTPLPGKKMWKLLASGNFSHPYLSMMHQASLFLPTKSDIPFW